MKKLISLGLIIIAVIAVFPGSAGNERLTDLTVIQALGIDYKNGGFTVTVQYLNINKGTGTNEGVKGNITETVKGKGSTIEKALSNAEKTLPDKLFYRQNKLIVFTDIVEKEKGNELLSFLCDSTKCRPDVCLAKSSSNAEDIIKNSQRKSRVPAESVCNQLKRENASFFVYDYLNSYSKKRLPVLEAGKSFTRVRK